MKKLLLATILAVPILSLTGCVGTPAYSCGFPTIGTLDTPCTGEHWNRIIRNQRYEFGQVIDDLDSAFMLDPASHMTKWNVR